ncbi:uncharacterized protein LOC131224036 isoform X2 [Magnolia sinica]|uniref:uncharacterized protein LOC131224036 isoform X2 n=1 Tax=Magnolia sinica TaxID=86752 RepID=UPI0026598E62|nr:uncharacterized protein LOC131224036 isoform X2 [Magnolia sinica]
MMKNLKVDPSSEAIDSNVAASKDGSPFDATSCISSSGDATSSFQESDVDHESLIAEQGIYYPASNYYGYCYPGLLCLLGLVSLEHLMASWSFWFVLAEVCPKLSCGRGPY